MFINIILIILGFVILIKGADFLVDGSAQIAKKFHIPELIIGMTIVAMGTSMPEVLVSVKSSLEGHSDISLGNVIGSNLANLLLILGICAMMKKGLEIKKETRKFDSPFCFVITIILLLVCNFGANMLGITRWEGVLLLTIFAGYIIYITLQAKKEASEEQPSSNERISMGKALLYLLLGIIGLKFGADFVVDNSVEVAQILGISEKIIGLTIIAIGTSLPELVSSITAVRKGENDLAIGNIIGSNIFNILLILGIASVIKPINYNISYNFDIFVLLFSTLLLILFPYIGKKNFMTKPAGITYVIIYVIYITTLIFIR